MTHAIIRSMIAVLLALLLTGSSYPRHPMTATIVSEAHGFTLITTLVPDAVKVCLARVEPSFLFLPCYPIPPHITGALRLQSSIDELQPGDNVLVALHREEGRALASQVVTVTAPIVLYLPIIGVTNGY